MKKLLMLFLFILLLCSFTGCDFAGGTTSSRELILYSTLEPKFTDELVAAYNAKNKKNKSFAPVKVIYELSEKSPTPNLVLGPRVMLIGLKQEGKLQQCASDSAALLPQEFKDVDGYWQGVFYDPLVFVINQQFARRVGQKNLQSWNDLENLVDVRFTMENLNNTLGTMNLLAAMACHMGEQSAITYMWNANRFMTSYTKFPFSSIRLVATGEADMTVTVRSMVSKYLENEFPAYVVLPKEGSPANMYGVAVYKETKQLEASRLFMEWLLAEDYVKVISQKQDTGFVFLVQEGLLNPKADPSLVWLNKDYLTVEKLEALTNQWVEKVRFSK